MILSPPFLVPRRTNDNDSQWIERCMPLDIPRAGVPRGVFPVGKGMCWHGGVHLTAPIVRGHRESVRAISDGQVIFIRQPTPATTDPSDPLNYNPQGTEPARTDDGCIVIQHDVEIGVDHSNHVTSLRFFSIYMHLSSITCATENVGGASVPKAIPFDIQRKDVIGQAGHLYGENHRIHFEIVLGEDQLSGMAGCRLLPSEGYDGRIRTGPVDPDDPSKGMIDDNGRLDSVFGEIYFQLPVGTPVYALDPGKNVITPTAAPVHSLTDELIVGMSFANGNGRVANRGDIAYKSYQLNGTQISTDIIDSRGDYELYREARDINDQYVRAGAAAIPAISPLYEMLKFGRVVEPATHENLNPADVPMWRQVHYSGGQGWINLRASNGIVYSDADLPYFKGWRIDHVDNNQDTRCDSATIMRLMDQDQNGTTTEAEIEAQLSDANVRERLAHHIVLFHTEWDINDIQARWGWLQTSTPQNPDPMDDEEYEAYIRHVQALCFWDSTQITGTGLNQWHFHPVAFIKHFRKCGWLDQSTLARLYPATPLAQRETYRTVLNQVMRKYGLNQRYRWAHFIGQGYIESIGLQCMVEGSASFRHNPHHASFASEIGGFYSDPTDLYGYFHRYEAAGNGLGNVERADLRDALGNPLPVVLGRDTRGRPTVTSPRRNQIDAAQSHVGDGMKFRGRGFKQLTGLYNYTEYWVFRGWILRSAFTANWWAVAHPAVPNLPDPQRISTVPYNCIDSGGYFAAANRLIRAADGGISRTNADNVSRIINRYSTGSFGRRFTASRNAYRVLGDE